MKLHTLFGAAALACCCVLPKLTQAAELGVYVGPGCVGAARLDAYSAWLGRRVTRSSDFLANESWTAMEAAAARSAKCWSPKGVDMMFSVSMLTTDNKTTLEAGALGDYDQHFRNIATALVQNGYPNAVIRIGWEFNYSWFPWAAKKNPQAWVTYWRRIVVAMRSVPGANFKFDWCLGSGAGDLNPETVYPGDAYVDSIGMDIYNATWAKVPQTTQVRWNYRMTKPYGLLWHRNFAALHGKPMSYGEWGTGTRPDGHGLGDDPEFITLMGEWIKSNNVAFHNYWDYTARDYNGMLSNGQFPLSAEQFIAQFK